MHMEKTTPEPRNKNQWQPDFNESELKGTNALYEMSQRKHSRDKGPKGCTFYTSSNLTLKPLWKFSIKILKV